MKILVISCGSPSLKYQLIDMEDESALAKDLYERIGVGGPRLTRETEGKDKHVVENPMPNHSAAIKMVMNTLVDPVYGVIKGTSEISAVGCCVLHVGTVYGDSIIVSDDVKGVVRRCFDFGPLYNPANLMDIEACEETIPGTPNVVVFDTAFGMSMPEKAYLYVIPHEYFGKCSIRRYSFHGISHKFVSGKVIRFSNLDSGKTKVTVYHLGNDASVSTSIDGKCVDTSMGLTPLEGLTMGARSGDIDPAVVQLICNKEGKTVDEVLDILSKKSDVLGASGDIPSDFRDIENAKAEDNHLAAVVLDAFQYRMIKYISAYAVAINGVDAIVFTTGVGGNDKLGEKAICESLGYLGVEIDGGANNVRSQERIISVPDSKVKVMLIPANEELVIVRETLALVK